MTSESRKLLQILYGSEIDAHSVMLPVMMKKRKTRKMKRMMTTRMSMTRTTTRKMTDQEG